MATKLSEAQDTLLAQLAQLSIVDRTRLEEVAEKLGGRLFDAFVDYFEAVAEEQDYHEDMRNFQRVL